MQIAHTETLITMNKIVKYYTKIKELCVKKNTIFVFPVIAFILDVMIYKSVVSFFALVAWFVIMFLNSHEEI